MILGLCPHARINYPNQDSCMHQRHMYFENSPTQAPRSLNDFPAKCEANALFKVHIEASISFENVILVHQDKIVRGSLERNGA